MVKKLLKFRVISIIFLTSFVLVLGGSLWTYFALKKINGPLIVHFNNIVGINQVGGLGDLMRVAITGLVIVIVNFFVTLELEERDWFLGKLLAAATLFVSILIFIAFAAIISVN